MKTISKAKILCVFRSGKNPAFRGVSDTFASDAAQAHI